MDVILFFAVAGIVLGMAAAFYFVTGLIKDSNEIGNTKGDHLDYIDSFYLQNAKDNVSRFLDINKM